jgi:hypothetical protein
MVHFNVYISEKYRIISNEIKDVNGLPYFKKEKIV